MVSAADSDHPLHTDSNALPPGKRGGPKEIPLHEMQMGSLQQEFCACDDYNVKSVILMSTGLLLLWLHFANILHILVITSCMMNILFTTLR